MFGWSIQSKIFNPDEKIVIWSSTSGKKGYWHLPNLKVNQIILSKLNNEKKIVELYISVHYRNTDIKNNINIFIKKIIFFCKIRKVKTVYLATDDANALNIFRKRLSGFKIIQLANPKSNVKNQHYSSTTKKDCYNQIYGTLRDLYFIPSYNSGLSRFIIMQIAKKNNIFNLESKKFYF